MKLTRRDFGIASGAGAAMALMPGSGWAATATSHGLSAFGDLKYPADFPHFDYVNPSAPKGGTWSTGYGNVTFDSFNPFILKGNSAIGVNGLIFDSLMTGSGDEADAMYGLIAESAELPEDRAWVAFNLRPEARFHDGSPITSEDVVFTYNILIEKGHPSYRVLLSPVQSVKAEGPGRVVFTFDPDAAKRDLPMLVAGLSILSKAYYDTVDFAESSLTPPLGNGPYKIGKFEQGARVVFDRVEDYWAADLPVNVGRHNFDQVRFEYFRDRSAAFEGLKGGTFLFNEEFWSKFWATAYTPENFPAIARGDVVTDTIPDERPAGSQGFWFNMRRKKFEDIRVREAIGLAFDFEWSNQRLFYNLYTRTDSFFEGGPMQAEGPPSPGELAILEKFADKLPPEVLSGPAFVPPVTDGSGRNRRNLRKAAKLLDEAGYTVVDKVRQKDGVPLEFEFLIGSQGFARIAQPMVQSLEKIGINASLREVDPAQYKKRTDDFDYDIVVDRKSMSLTPGVELRNYFHSSSANSQGSQNTAGIEDPVVDELLDLIERAENREALTSAVKALDRVLRAQHYWIPQWSKGSHTIAYWDLYDRPETKPKYQRGVIDTWWVDAEKEAKLKAAGRI
ncbi:MAG: extracellular solute-binding protein [Pseudomonadota bacterium]